MCFCYVRQLHVQHIIKQILQGLDQLHSLGMGHCDLTSHNVMINDACEIILVDFQSVRNFAQPIEDKSLANSGTWECMGVSLICFCCRCEYVWHQRTTGRSQSKTSIDSSISYTMGSSFICTTWRNPFRSVRERRPNGNREQDRLQLDSKIGCRCLLWCEQHVKYVQRIGKWLFSWKERYVVRRMYFSKPRDEGTWASVLWTIRWREDFPPCWFEFFPLSDDFSNSVLFSHIPSHRFPLKGTSKQTPREGSPRECSRCFGFFETRRPFWRIDSVSEQTMYDSLFLQFLYDEDFLMCVGLHLMRNLLQFDPDRRFTVSEALAHHFLSGCSWELSGFSDRFWGVIIDIFSMTLVIHSVRLCVDSLSMLFFGCLLDVWFI